MAADDHHKDDGVLGLKIGVIFIMLALSLVFGLLPIYV